LQITSQEQQHGETQNSIMQMNLISWSPIPPSSTAPNQE